MKIKIKHGLLFLPDNPFSVTPKGIKLNLTSSTIVAAFLGDGVTTLVWLDSANELSWTVANKATKIFIELVNGNVLPLAIQVDGTERFYSGSSFPKSGSNGSTFHHVTYNKLYLMMSGRWVEKSVLCLGTVVGNKINIQSAGSQLGGFIDTDAGEILYGQDGVALPPNIPQYTSHQLFNFGGQQFTVNPVSDNSISVISVGKSIPPNTAVSCSTGCNIANVNNECDGVVIQSNAGVHLICHSGIVSNIHLPLYSGAVFHDEDGKLTSTANSKYYQRVGTYDQLNKTLIVNISAREIRI